GVARGKYTEADFFKVTSFMQQNLALYDASFDGVYFCPHHPEAPLEKYRRVCECRKPKSGMFFKAAADLDIDLSASVMFGDHASDLEAASGAGIKNLYLTGEHLLTEGPKCPDARTFHLLSDAVNDLNCRIRAN
ncbi:MAG: HAD hydrolase-like protein, partial [Succinivibrio sp.]